MFKTGYFPSLFRSFEHSGIVSNIRIFEIRTFYFVKGSALRRKQKRLVPESEPAAELFPDARSTDAVMTRGTHPCELGIPSAVVLSSSALPEETGERDQGRCERQRGEE